MRGRGFSNLASPPLPSIVVGRDLGWVFMRLQGVFGLDVDTDHGFLVLMLMLVLLCLCCVEHWLATTVHQSWLSQDWLNVSFLRQSVIHKFIDELGIFGSGRITPAFKFCELFQGLIELGQFYSAGGSRPNLAKHLFNVLILVWVNRVAGSGRRSSPELVRCNSADLHLQRKLAIMLPHSGFRCLYLLQVPFVQ